MSSLKPYNLLRHELIGLYVWIIESDNPRHIGIKGKIVDETKQTLIISQEERDKVIAKKGTIFKVWLPERTIVGVNGKYLIGRPEDRVKKRRRLW